MEIPQLNWFESNPWAKIGNCFTGSVGATSLHKNAFLYKISYYRPEDGSPYLEAQIYSVKTASLPESERVTKTFVGTPDGRNEMTDWINLQLEQFQSSPESKEKITY